MYTPQQIAQACQVPLAAAQANWPLLVQALRDAGIDDRATETAVAANVAEETAHTFQPIEEFGDQAYWEGELGADWWYHGRGFNQETWRSGYEWAANVTGLDCVNHPELLLIAANSARVTAEFVKMKGIPAVANAGNWVEVRRLWNGGSNGLATVLAHVNALLALPWTPPGPPVTTVAKATPLYQKPDVHSHYALDEQHKDIAALGVHTVVTFTPDPHDPQHRIVAGDLAHVNVAGHPWHGWVKRADLSTVGG